MSNLIFATLLFFIGGFMIGATSMPQPVKSAIAQQHQSLKCPCLQQGNETRPVAHKE